MPPRYQNVVWDWNGTLLDDVDLALGIANDIFREHRLEPLTAKRYRQIFDFPVRLYYERAGMDFTHVSFEATSDRFCREVERRLGSVALFDGARGCLQTVQRMGVRQFVLSSTEQAALLRMVSGFGLEQMFHEIRGNPDGLARGKIGSGEALLQAHGIDPRSALMVGDTHHDWEVADALGMDCVLVAGGHHSPERLAASGCPVLPSIEAVPDLLQAASWDETDVRASSS